LSKKLHFPNGEHIVAHPAAKEGATLVVKAAAAGRRGRLMDGICGPARLHEYKPTVLDEKKATEVWEALYKTLDR
jgi:hypothetical protein